MIDVNNRHAVNISLLIVDPGEFTLLSNLYEPALVQLMLIGSCQGEDIKLCKWGGEEGHFQYMQKVKMAE